MSIPKKHTITCPKCGTSGDFTAWDSEFFVPPHI